MTPDMKVTAYERKGTSLTGYPETGNWQPNSNF